jgi:hypothetical protein
MIRREAYSMHKQLARYKGLSAPGTGSPRRMTPSSLFELGSMTETVFVIGRGPHVAVHFFHAAHQRFWEFGVRVSGRSRVVVLSRRVGRLGLGAPIEAESAECE